MQTECKELILCRGVARSRFPSAKVGINFETTKYLALKNAFRVDLCQESVFFTPFLYADFLYYTKKQRTFACVFFIVLDLRLTKVRGSAESLFLSI